MIQSKYILQIFILFLLITSISGLVAGTGNATLSTIPKYSEAIAGQTFMIRVDVNPGINEIYSIQFDLYFDPFLIEAIKVEKGQFLSQDGSQTLNPVPEAINNSLGKVEYAESRIGIQTGVRNPGTLAVITFKVKDSAKIPGNQSFVLGNVVISDNNLNKIYSEVTGGEFKVIEGGKIYAAENHVTSEKMQVVTSELSNKINKSTDTEKISVKISVDQKDSIQNQMNLVTFLNSREKEVSNINQLSDSITGDVSKRLINEIGDLPFVTEITLYKETMDTKEQPGIGIIIVAMILIITFMKLKHMKNKYLEK